MEEFSKIFLKGWFCPKPPFLACVDGSQCDRPRPTGYIGVTFFDLGKPFIYYKKGQRCAHPESTFYATYRFGCINP